MPKPSAQLNKEQNGVLVRYSHSTHKWHKCKGKASKILGQFVKLTLGKMHKSFANPFSLK